MYGGVAREKSWKWNFFQIFFLDNNSHPEETHCRAAGTLSTFQHCATTKKQFLTIAHKKRTRRSFEFFGKIYMAMKKSSESSLF